MYTSEVFGFNVPGKLTYRVHIFNGEDKVKTVQVPNNYCLEVEQFGQAVSKMEKCLILQKNSV